MSSASYLTQTQVMRLCQSQFVCLLPLFWVLPSWLLIYWLVFVVWRLRIHSKKIRFPGTLLKVAVIAVGLAGIVVTVPVLLSIEAFVCFFVVAFSLKILELESKDDALLLVSVSFISLACVLIFYQSVWLALYVLAAFMFLLWAWLSIYRRRTKTVFAQWRDTVAMLAFLLPLMVLLFVVMPRAGQLWHMPGHSQQGSTGFGDSMSPGDISELIQSDEIAFRVGFAQVPASSSELYWRGWVLDEFDGRKWSLAKDWRLWSRQYSSSKQPNPKWQLDYAPESLINYTVLLEPHQQEWLFTLMAPINASSNNLNLVFSDHVALRNRKDVSSRSQYQVNSAQHYRYAVQNLTAEEQQKNTLLPNTGNEKSQALAQQWRLQYGSGIDADKKIINIALEHYQQSFVYTLKPPLLGQDSIDDFLFLSQRGFCEHFASSFVFLMRASGIPARVVLGYQGGKLNPNGNYVLVRQSDAHAWAEVWLQGEGWQRIDPTAAVAPSRIELDLSQALSANERILVGGFSSTRMLLWLQMKLDVFSYNWQRFILNYDDKIKMELFAQFLGVASLWRIAIFFTALSGLLLLGYFLVPYLFAPKPITSAAQQAFNVLLRRLDRLGFAMQRGETPRQFVERVGRAQPQWWPMLETLTTTYYRLEYCAYAHGLPEFIHLCRSWRPKMRT